MVTLMMTEEMAEMMTEEMASSERGLGARLFVDLHGCSD
jgi:Fe-S cluster assembly iron-binding protein IscA